MEMLKQGSGSLFVVARCTASHEVLQDSFVGRSVRYCLARLKQTGL